MAPFTSNSSNLYFQMLCKNIGVMSHPTFLSFVIMFKHANNLTNTRVWEIQLLIQGFSAKSQEGLSPHIIIICCLQINNKIMATVFRQIGAFLGGWRIPSIIR